MGHIQSNIQQHSNLLLFSPWGHITQLLIPHILEQIFDKEHTRF